MNPDRPAVVDLLGAWALDALEAKEARAVEARLATDPELAGRARALRTAVAELARSTIAPRPDDADPEPGDRASILAAATGVRVPGIDLTLGERGAATPGEAYVRQADDLEALTRSVHDADWNRPVAPYPWSAHRLMIHLLAVERYFLALLGLGPDPVPGTPVDDHLALADPLLEEWLARDPTDVVTAWSDAASLVGDHLLAATAEHLDRRLVFHGVDASTRSVTIVRAFELWTHADDLRAATGRPLVAPDPAVLHTMADWSVGALATADALLRPGADTWSARIVLIGDGGGTWSIHRGRNGADPDTLVVADVVDYCRLASRRLDREDLTVEVDGDRELCRALLEAASLFSV